MSVYIAEMGWTFNVVNPDAATNAPTIAAVGIAFTVLSALVVSLRLYVRSSIVKKISIGECSQFGLVPCELYLIGRTDDWIIVGTWVTSPSIFEFTLANIFIQIMSCIFTALTLSRELADNYIMDDNELTCWAETRWGLGLQNVEDLPPQNLFYFNLVSS